MNNSIEEIRSILFSDKNKTIAVSAHTSPDGDAVGASCALALAINDMGGKARVFLEEYSDTFNVIPTENIVEYTIDDFVPDIYVSVDCGDIERLGAFGESYNKAQLRVNIDHHKSNTYFGMMVVFFVSAMNIFQLRQSFKTFATSLKEAAHIDGCSNFNFFIRILLPTNFSTILTVFITAFIGTWNTYLWPLLVTNKTEMRTVQVGITMLNFSEGTVYGPIMAASMIVLLPSLVLFLTFQKKIVTGMMAGGVKG